MIIRRVLKKIAEILGIKNYISAKLRGRGLREQVDNFHKGSKALLFKVDEMLNKQKVEYWLNYGTLLGAYRDHNFIKHDYDMDIGVWWKDFQGLKEIFLDNGFNLIVEFRFGPWDNPEKVEYRFEYAGAFIDVDFYTIDENQMAYTYNPLFIDNYDYSNKGVVHPIICERINNPIRGFKKIDFIGREFCVPSNTEEYLIYNYGSNWKIPKSVSDGFDYHDVASNITRVEMEGWVLVSN